MYIITHMWLDLPWELVLLLSGWLYYSVLTTEVQYVCIVSSLLEGILQEIVIN